MRSQSLIALLAAAIVALTLPQAAAQSRAGGWDFTVAPYLFAAGMEGSTTVKGFEADVDVPLSTILDNLDLAGMVHFDMMNERWLISSNLIFVDLEDSRDVANGGATVSLGETLFEVAGGYRVSPVVSLLVGARWVDLRTGLDFSGPRVEEGGDASASWVDPFVGGRAIVPLSERWRFSLHGDVGGFGVGSDLAWHAQANIGFRASGLVEVILGYRAIDMDYEQGDGRDLFQYDILTAGPQLGVAFRF